MSTIDRLDAEIISKLADNARIGIAELAAELGVSRTTIQLRLKRLEDDGILLGFQPILNLSKIGAQ
ncbi:MAG: Lrp/AsnC family transcriptional regulator, partial [Microbacterium sp.]|uniref:Lrp/AsnC family transcriptional regulator n=1 Tax=Microbacterium sp. TaxID=51671 RepID=UPI003F9AFA27